MPPERRIIVQAFCDRIAVLNPDVIAGTASSAIDWAAWTAEQLDKPLVYVRKAAKEYGKQQRIEGGDIQGKTVVVIEDLISAGGSSLSAVNACREVGAKVLAIAAIFTYQFANVAEKLHEMNCQMITLSNVTTLTQVAAEQKFIRAEQLALIQEWNVDPQGWGPTHSFPNRT